MRALFLSPGPSRGKVVLRAAAGLLTLGVLAPVVTAPPPADAALGSDRFLAGEVYRGTFGAPSVWVENGRYYAYATNTGGNNLPMVTSTDLETWRAHEPWPLSAGLSTWKGYADAMPQAAPWAAKLEPNGKPGVWAPSVIKLRGRYVNAYTAQVTRDSNRHCLSLASADSPLGPFRDSSATWLHCSRDPMGSIDPAWLKVGRKVYLIWKNAGVKGSKPSTIKIRRMKADGSGFRPGTREHLLLRTEQSWEGNVIEAPSPLVVNGKVYLLYSGNDYQTDKYAIGYATCDTPLGPCRRVTAKPLLATGGAVAGPGAQATFIDLSGRIRMAYSAWEFGQVGYPASSACLDTADGCNQRRMYIATLAVGSDGRLQVTDRY
jgi:hypothetical protein